MRGEHRFLRIIDIKCLRCHFVELRLNPTSARLRSARNQIKEAAGTSQEPRPFCLFFWRIPADPLYCRNHRLRTTRVLIQRQTRSSCDWDGRTAWYLVHLFPRRGGQVAALDKDRILFIPSRGHLPERSGVVSRAHPWFRSRTRRHG